MSMDTEQRLSALERKLAEHEQLIAKLAAYAKLTPTGRTALKLLGLPIGDKPYARKQS